MNSPYLPEKKVSVFIADTHIDGAIVIKPPEISVLPKGLRRHADLGISIVSAKKAVCPPDSYSYYLARLAPYGFKIIKGKKPLGCNYPADSAYNVGIVGKKCFLNKSVCDKHLLDILISEGFKIIDVKQGYTKCSICPIDENSFITADKSIAAAGEKEGMEVLLITNGKIVLSGYSNGFFGGCCGKSSRNELLINGELNTLPDADRIKEFLDKKNIHIKSLKKGDVVDIGSILPILT